MSRVIYDGVPVPDEPKASVSAAAFLAQAKAQRNNHEGVETGNEVNQLCVKVDEQSEEILELRGAGEEFSFIQSLPSGRATQGDVGRLSANQLGPDAPRLPGHHQFFPG